MEQNTRSRLLGKLISGSEIKAELKNRKSSYDYETISFKSEELRIKIREEHEQDDWEFDKDFKNSIRMKKLKDHDLLFENKMWTLFANLGFVFLNKDRDFNLPYDKNNSKNNQQIDVFIKDNECAIYIECKSSKSNRLAGDFKKDLEAWTTKKAGIENSIQQLFPNEKLKTKFLFATYNQGMGPTDLERLANIGGIHFDENKFQYFIDMHKQLGGVAKYQLLGYLFAGSTIPELENKVPAIQGKMGGHTYYSFSIEPEKLLKIGYVLHRTRANEDMLPTYQRLIKKARLKSVSEFINNTKTPGYFPNSIVINIVDPKKKIQFEQANTQVPNAISKVGVLHLPKEYKSAFIIDGQHRLYGYADSKYRFSNTIPVVAFVNLEKSEQVKLFMQINENQQAVPKSLMTTLNADLKWDSENKLEQIDALCSQIAISLSEDRNSSLFNYITVGQDSKVLTPQCIITGLKKGKFLGVIKKDKIEVLGIFYKGNINEANENLLHYLKLNFEYLTNNLNEDFSLGKESFLFVNKGVTAIIMLLSDILELTIEITNQDVNKSTIKIHFEESKKYLDSLIRFVKNVNENTKNILMREKGGSAPSIYWRNFQVHLNTEYKEFNPIGLAEYIKNEERALNSKTYEIIKNIEEYMRKDFKIKLVGKYGEEWAWKKGVPEKIQDDAESRMRKKNRSRSKDNETEEWDNLNLIHYREIASQNWTYTNEDKTRSPFLDQYYTIQGEEKLNKEDKTKWFVVLNEIRNIVSHSSSDQVTEEQYSFAQKISTSIIK